MFGIALFRSELARLRRDTRGSFIMVFGLTLIPMLGLLGLGVDYSAANRLKTGLDAANDSAILAGLTAALQYIEAKPNYGSTAASVTQQAQSAATTLAETVFLADSANLPLDASNSTLKSSTANYAPTIARSTDGLTLTANATYNAASHNIFGELFGSNAWLVSGYSAATISLPLYTQVYMALDVSQSMGIGASQDDMTALQQATAKYWPAGDDPSNPNQGGCVFGCHVAVNDPDSHTNYCAPATCPVFETLAENSTAPTIYLRIDYVRKAVGDVINLIQNEQLIIGYNTISLGIYTMDQTFNTITKPISDITQLQSFESSIDLEGAPVVNESGPGDSYITATSPLTGKGDALGNLPSIIMSNTTPGNGASAATPIVAVIIVTDGVNDATGTQALCGKTYHCISAFDPSVCTTLKNLNSHVKVAVVYTTYVPFPTNVQYSQTVGAANINSGSPTTLETNLTNCATSTDYYAEATKGTDVQSAIDNLYKLVTSQGTLTQ